MREESGVGDAAQADRAVPGNQVAGEKEPGQRQQCPVTCR